MSLAHATDALASGSNASGATTNSSAFSTGYGVTGLALVTNGGTGPTTQCNVTVQVSPDGGTTWHDWITYPTGTTASAVYEVPIALSLGDGADPGTYRIVFSGNTGQAVTVQYDGAHTTSL